VTRGLQTVAALCNLMQQKTTPKFMFATLILQFLTLNLQITTRLDF